MLFDQLRRREFLAVLGGAAAAWPQATWAQQSGKRPTIGFLGADASSWGPWTAAFVARLRELGWVEGRTIAIEYRWSEGRAERVAEIAAEFVQRNVDLIVTNENGAAAMKRATAVIPIVFVLSNDPIGNGLVGSLARPGGNVTGLSTQQTDAAGKRLELLREVNPRLHRVAIVADFGAPNSVREMREVEAAAQKLGLEVAPVEIRRAQDIAPAFAALNGKADALYVVANALTVANHASITIFVLAARLPMIVSVRDLVRPGALMSYAANFPDIFRRTAEYVDKILRGAKPADIPVEQPTKFELVVNLNTAKALGLAIPKTFLWRADEVIE
jgi:putative ABC transport system substrate-binding protein